MICEDRNDVKDVITYLLADGSFITKGLEERRYEWYNLFAYELDDDPDEEGDTVLVRQDVEGYNVRDAFEWLNKRQYLTKIKSVKAGEDTYSDYKPTEKGKEVLQFILDHVTPQEWDNIVYWSNLGIDNAYAGNINNEFKLIVADRSSDTYVINPNAK